MGKLVKLTQGDIDKIQIDEGIVITNFEETDETVIGPVRGGAEATIQTTIRDIEFDGRKGKTMGLQSIDEQNATIALKTLCCSQDNLLMALPGAKKETDGTIVSDSNGIIARTKYLKNVAVLTMLADGSYKALIIYNAMHEGDFKYAPAPKGENEHSLNYVAHYDPIATTNVDQIYKIKDYATNPLAS